MPGFSAGSAYVDLVPRLQKGWSGAVEKEVDGPLRRIRGKAGAIGKAVGIGLGAGVIGGGALLFKIGADLDSALDNIQTKTGLVGDELSSVQDSFRNVAKRVPNDMGQVSDAVAALASRTGLTGKPLEDLSTRLLTLSRLTGSDLNSTIEQSTRFFGDWGVAVADQGPTLDEMFRLSQKTGVGMTDLQERLVKFGGPLRQLGFGWEESAALIAKFQKEGVNTDLVLGSMRISLGKMAKAGEDPQKTLARVTDEIKNAGSAGEANAKAIELFGARAGPDMAAAIREGRFEVADLLKTMKSGKGTIVGSAKATDDFGEKWGVLKNRLILAAEPLAGKVFDAVNKLFDKLVPFGEWIGDRMPGFLDRMSKALRPVGKWLGEIAGDVSLFWNALRTGFTKDEGTPIERFALMLREKVLPVVRQVLEWIGRNWKPILIAAAAAFALLTAPISTVVAALIYAYVRFGWFRNAVDAVVRWIVDVGIPMVKQFALAVREWIEKLVGWWKDHWEQIRAIVTGALELVQAIVARALDVILYVWQHYGDLILDVLKATFRFLRSIVEAGLKIIRGVIDFFVGLLTGDWSRAWDGIKGILSGVWDGIVAVAKFGVTLLKDGILAVLRTFEALWSAAWDRMKSILGSIWDGLIDAGRAALNGILHAIRSALNFAIDLLNAALDAIDKAAGPWINFGEIPHVPNFEIPTPKKPHGPVHPTVPPAGGVPGKPGRNFTSSDFAALVPASSGTSGPLMAEGAVQVDARGITEPEVVGDYTARLIGWRLTTAGRR